MISIIYFWIILLACKCSAFDMCYSKYGTYFSNFSLSLANTFGSPSNWTSDLIQDNMFLTINLKPQTYHSLTVSEIYGLALVFSFIIFWVELSLKKQKSFHTSICCCRRRLPKWKSFVCLWRDSYQPWLPFQPRLTFLSIAVLSAGGFF